MYSIGSSIATSRADMRQDNVEMLIEIDDNSTSNSMFDLVSPTTPKSFDSRRSSKTTDCSRDSLEAAVNSIAMIALTMQAEAEHLAFLQELELHSMGFEENEYGRSSFEAALDDSRSEIVPAYMLDPVSKQDPSNGMPVQSRVFPQPTMSLATRPDGHRISDRSLWQWQQIPQSTEVSARPEDDESRDAVQSSFLRMSTGFSTVDTDMEKPVRNIAARPLLPEQSFKDATPPKAIPERSTSFAQRPGKRQEPVKLSLAGNKSLLSVAEGEEIPHFDRRLVNESSCLSPRSFASSRPDSFDGSSSMQDFAKRGLRLSTERIFPQPKSSIGSLRSRLSPSQGSTFWSATSRDSESPPRDMLRRPSQASVKSQQKKEDDASAWDPDDKRKGRKKSSKTLKAEQATLWAKAEVARLLDDPFEPSQSQISLLAPGKAVMFPRRRSPLTSLSNDSQCYGSETSTPTQSRPDNIPFPTRGLPNDFREGPHSSRHRSLDVRTK